MRLVIERATSGTGSSSGPYSVTSTISDPRCPQRLRLQLKFVSPDAAHSIKLNALPKIERAAFLALEKRGKELSQSLLSSQLPPLAAALARNKMSSMNPLMTISIHDISSSPSPRAVVIFYYICINSALFGKAISICIFSPFRFRQFFGNHARVRFTPRSTTSYAIVVAVFDFQFESDFYFE